MKRIETSKGRFVITDNTEEINRWINNGRFLGVNHVNRLSEKDARDIVGAELNEDYLLITLDWYRGKLNSLLESQGIEITNNTYIFKV